MGEFYAIACAVVWSAAVIFFRKSGETIDPFALNLFRVVISTVLLTASLVALGKPLIGDAAGKDIAILVASGVIAIAISDTLFHMCLNRVGAGLNAVVDSLYSPFIILFAYVMLHETVGPRQFAGMALIIGGVIMASRVAPPPDTSARTLVAGILFGVAAMATIAFGIVLAKPVLVKTDVLWATTIRQYGALAALGLVTLVRSDRERVLRVFRPSASWRFSVPGTVLGSYVSLTLWIAGMKYAATGTAGILNQSSTLFILVLATLVLKEPFTRRKAVSVALTSAGILLTVSG